VLKFKRYTLQQKWGSIAVWYTASSQATRSESWQRLDPFESALGFKTANSFFKSKFSAGKIDDILQLWVESLEKHGDVPPFFDHKELYSSIDAIPIGSVPWQSFAFAYTVMSWILPLIL